MKKLMLSLLIVSFTSQAMIWVPHIAEEERDNVEEYLEETYNNERFHFNEDYISKLGKKVSQEELIASLQTKLKEIPILIELLEEKRSEEEKKEFGKIARWRILKLRLNRNISEIVSELTKIADQNKN